MNYKIVLLILLGLLALVSLSGCMMGAGSAPMAEATLDKLQADLEEIDGLDASDRAKILERKDAYDTAANKLENGSEKERLGFLAAYCDERLGNFDGAVKAYDNLGKSSYGSMANFRKGEIAHNAPGISEADKKAKDGYSKAGGGFMRPQGSMFGCGAAPSQEEEKAPEILVRVPALASEPLVKWTREDLREAANSRADLYYRETLSYKVVDELVHFLGANKAYSYGLAVFILAFIVKLITTPLTNRQIKSMREMQAIQPLLSDLQKKHKDDRESMMREQMKLFKEHGVNPLSGCLPLLIQLPFLIWVYRAVWAYNWQFEGTSFLWIGNLALPDMPVLVLYAASMYFSQKLTATPTADPQQQQMQRMMTILFPIMFLFLFQSMPAAFILYWLAQNVLMTGHQYYMLKKNPPQALAAKTAEKKVVKRK